MTALDVKYTFETMLAPGFVSDKKAEFIKAIASIEVIDPQTVVFHCHEPFPGFPNAILPIGIIPEGTTGQQATKPIGTGPFRFVSYTEDQEVQLARHKDYFDGAPTIEELRVRIVPDNSTRESELRKGSADLAINADFDPITVESLQKAAGISVEQIDGTNLTHLGVNLNDPVLGDRRCGRRSPMESIVNRSSITYCVGRHDRHQAVFHHLNGLMQLASEVTVMIHRRRRHCLDQAGYPEKAGSARLRLTLRTSTIAISRKIGEAMQEQLKQVGIGLELQPLERQKLVQDMSEGNFQLYLNTSVGGNQSTDFFKFAYATESAPPNGQNRSRFSNQRVDQLLATSRRSTREEQRAIFAEIQEILAEELPHIYLWYPATIVVRRERVGGLKLEPSGDWQVVRRVTLR
jgi:peptide/nickel transport system substrate-binding protein